MLKPQGVELLPSGQKLPGRQVPQTEVPVEKYPGLHPGEHILSPAADTSPAGQAVQLVAAGAEENVPAAQSEQTGCPAPL